MPVCAKIIYSWVRKVLSIAVAHMSLGTLQDAVASVVLAAVVYLLSILQADDWATVPMPASHKFLMYITVVDQYQDLVEHAVLCL